MYEEKSSLIRTSSQNVDSVNKYFIFVILMIHCITFLFPHKIFLLVINKNTDYI